jgi:hypothetical protein
VYFSFEKLKSADGNLIFQLKVRPVSYLQVVKDQQDYIEQLEKARESNTF